MPALLLDTHALLWFGGGDQRLPVAVRPVISDPSNAVFASAASAWEIATKFRIGKLPEGASLALDFAGQTAAFGFLPLPISIGHAQLAGSLAGVHRDPFDRILAAQAMLDGLALVSGDPAFDQFGMKRIW